MKILDALKNNKVLINIGVLILGLLLGWLFFGGSGSISNEVVSDGHSMALNLSLKLCLKRGVAQYVE